MKINSNITAYTTNNAYSVNERRLSISTGKLSSGFKLNKAGDDPANYAIASKMRAQLESLDKVKTNATTGNSVVQTAESAVGEIQSIIQRMNELAIKSANGTLSNSDREMVQEEVDQLKLEITRISESTEFNGMNLLDGTFENKGYCREFNEIKIEGYSDETPAGAYSMHLKYDEGYSLDSYSVFGNVQEIFGTIFPEVSEVKKVGTDYAVTLTSDLPTGVKVIRNYTIPETEISATGFAEINDTEDPSLKIQFQFEKKYDYTLTDGTTVPDGVSKASDLFGALSGYKQNCYVTNRTVDNEDFVTITSKNGSEVTLRITKRETIDDQDFIVDLNGLGAMRLQVGVDEGEVLALQLPQMSLNKLKIDDLDMTTERNATKAIGKVKYALDYVNSVRSRLGAYENRLDDTVSFVDASNEALNTSYSRIIDTDMAEEMTEYTNLQVLTQAGMSMLAQANEFPQQALQLLQ